MYRSLHTLFLLFSFLLVTFSNGFAQSPYTATFVARLGLDTVVVETYSMVNNHLYGKAFIRVPEDYIGVFNLHFYPDGTIRSFNMAAMDPSNSSLPYPAKAGIFPYMSNMICQNDTCYWYASNKGGSAEYANKHKAPAMDFVGGWTPIISLMEWQALRLHKTNKESLPLRLINDYIGVYEIGIRRASKDSLIFGGPFLEYTKIKTDAAGRITFINGQGTPWNYMVTKHAPMDVDAVAKRMTKTPSIGVPSPEVVEHYRIADSDFDIAYGKPSRRGRKVFGGIVPYDSLWRTGAGHPTILSISDDVKIGKTIIPKGQYSLYTIPRPDKWLLIFNTDLKKWPTDPVKSKDFAQVELKISKLPNRVEQLKIELLEANKQGANKRGILKFSWDDVEAYTDFIIVRK